MGPVSTTRGLSRARVTKVVVWYLQLSQPLPLPLLLTQQLCFLSETQRLVSDCLVWQHGSES